ncbi:MAG: MATE family efflux transporter [Solobacterium sp.]|nr:MATE family efflux transporter [Solobacterium sp.]
MNTDWKKKYIGPAGFYKETARIAVPLALQSALMSGQSMIDTLMVSWIGMVSAVGTAAQIDTLAAMINYGVVGGVSMFASQFFGADDARNMKRCTGLGLVLVLGNGILWWILATVFGRQILSFYMNDPEVVANGLLYLSISRFSLLINGVNFCFSNMFRSTKQPQISLRASILTTCTNILFNWLLIFGIGPFPEMGVRGAALGTIIAQMLSCIVLVSYAILSHQPFVGPLHEMFAFDREFLRPIAARIYPLIVNESTFGLGQTLFIKAFGMLGKEAMDAYYVGNQIFNLMTFVIYGYGNSVQILLGSELGKGHIDKAKQECDYHIGLAFVLSCILVLFLVLFARPLVSLFGLKNPTAETLAVAIVRVFAVKASMRLYNFQIFSILRSGGDAKILQFLDSGLEWLVGLPCAFLCVTVFHMKDIALVLLITQLEQLVRLLLGMRRVKTYKWARDLTKLVNG